MFTILLRETTATICVLPFRNLIMASVGFCNSVVRRSFSVTTCCHGKRNFRKFLLHNRGSKLFKEKQKIDPHPDIPVYSKFEILKFAIEKLP